MFVKPVDNGVITQTFAQHKANGQGGSYGTDIGVSLKYTEPIPVKLMYDCSIHLSGLSSTFGYRVWTKLLEGPHEGMYIVYPHMDSIDGQIHLGKVYKAGTTVGIMGNTGLIKVGKGITNNNDKHVPMPKGRHIHSECRSNPADPTTSIWLKELEEAYK